MNLFLVRFDVGDGVADRCDLLGVFVRDLDVESLLELHDKLHGVERVGAQVVGETCFGHDFRLLYTQLVDDDFDNFRLNF